MTKVNFIELPPCCGAGQPNVRIVITPTFLIGTFLEPILCEVRTAKFKSIDDIEKHISETPNCMFYMYGLREVIVDDKTSGYNLRYACRGVICDDWSQMEVLDPDFVVGPIVDEEE